MVFVHPSVHFMMPLRLSVWQAKRKLLETKGDKRLKRHSSFIHGPFTFDFLRWSLLGAIGFSTFP